MDEGQACRVNPTCPDQSTGLQVEESPANQQSGTSKRTDEQGYRVIRFNANGTVPLFGPLDPTSGDPTTVNSVEYWLAISSAYRSRHYSRTFTNQQGFQEFLADDSQAPVTLFPSASASWNNGSVPPAKFNCTQFPSSNPATFDQFLLACDSGGVRSPTLVRTRPGAPGDEVIEESRSNQFDIDAMLTELQAALDALVFDDAWFDAVAASSPAGVTKYSFPVTPFPNQKSGPPAAYCIYPADITAYLDSAPASEHYDGAMRIVGNIAAPPATVHGLHFGSVIEGSTYGTGQQGGGFGIATRDRIQMLTNCDYVLFGYAPCFAQGPGQSLQPKFLYKQLGAGHASVGDIIAMPSARLGALPKVCSSPAGDGVARTFVTYLLVGQSLADYVAAKVAAGYPHYYVVGGF